MVLLDRTEERAAIDEAIKAIGSGHSRVFVLAGEAGMGKTSLLKHAVDSASQLQTAWIAGIEAEGDLGFAALHRLMRPLMPRFGPATRSTARRAQGGIRIDHEHTGGPFSCRPGLPEPSRRFRI